MNVGENEYINIKIKEDIGKDFYMFLNVLDRIWGTWEDKELCPFEDKEVCPETSSGLYFLYSTFDSRHYPGCLLLFGLFEFLLPVYNV